MPKHSVGREPIYATSASLSNPAVRDETRYYVRFSLELVYRPVTVGKFQVQGLKEGEIGSPSHERSRTDTLSNLNSAAT